MIVLQAKKDKSYILNLILKFLWYCGVVVITTAQLHSTKPELKSCIGSNPACSMSEIRNGDNGPSWK